MVEEDAYCVDLMKQVSAAQASLAYRIAGDIPRNAQLLKTFEADRTPSGFLNATRAARVSTGLSIDPGPSADRVNATGSARFRAWRIAAAQFANDRARSGACSLANSSWLPSCRSSMTSKRLFEALT